MSDELKPCPCCGAPAGIEEEDWISYITCSRCSLRTYKDTFVVDLADDWNRRAGLPEELVERIRQQTTSFMVDQVADAVWRNSLLMDLLAWHERQNGCGE